MKKIIQIVPAFQDAWVLSDGLGQHRVHAWANVEIDEKGDNNYVAPLINGGKKLVLAEDLFNRGSYQIADSQEAIDKLKGKKIARRIT